MSSNDFLVAATDPSCDVLGRAGAIGLFVDSDNLVTFAADHADASSTKPAPPLFPGIADPLPLFRKPGLRSPEAIRLHGGAVLVPPPAGTRPSVEAGTVVRALVRAALAKPEYEDRPPLILPGGWMLLGAGAHLTQVADGLAGRSQLWQGVSRNDFAHSAYYMGAKRALLPFLMEALVQFVPREATFLDLMCGSGAVSGAAARLWPTFASDAMQFCLPLAAVQCGGYSSAQATSVLANVLDEARGNFEWLSQRIEAFLTMEETLFTYTGDYESLAKEYKEFAEQFPTYPSATKLPTWDPAGEVEVRRSSLPFSKPSCLFTCYFANVYLGLRQAAEVDSLRHAIAQIPNADDRCWAMGALIAAVSAVSTTYGGHFAQPYAAAHNLSDKSIGRVVTKRAMSVYREFEMRLLALAALSETVDHSATLVRGPWRPALDAVAKTVGTGPVVVYVDAPYRREEYSRYYHLLETLVAYSYPSANARTKVPNKSTGERFSSEFFTRSTEGMQNALAAVLTEVLDRGWTCAWSYSDVADAAIAPVLRSVRGLGQGRSVAAAYGYKRQGQHSQRREVTEYLLLLEPS